MSAHEARRRGWTQVSREMGLWARGAYRIQRGVRDWRWWYVLQFGPDYPHGREKTLRACLDAVDAVEVEP